MQERSNTTAILLAVGGLVAIGLLVWLFGRGGEPSETPPPPDAAQTAPPPSPSQTAPPSDVVRREPAEVTRPVAQAPTEAPREVEVNRRPAGFPQPEDPSQGQIAALQGDNDLAAEPPPEVLEEMYRDSQLMPPDDVLDDLRRKAEEDQPTAEQLERLYREAEADVEPSPEELEELRRQSEIR